MNKVFKTFVTIAMITAGSISLIHAEEAQVETATAAEAVAENTASAQETVAAVAPAATDPTPAEPVAAAPAATAAPAEVLATDNLEFVSGEVSALDEAAKSVSVRLYGDTEAPANEKILKVSVDENTDITDGEQDRDLKSLAVGTEVDVEYDPATNKATYIFVY